MDGGSTWTSQSTAPGLIGLMTAHARPGLPCGGSARGAPQRGSTAVYARGTARGRSRQYPLTEWAARPSISPGRALIWRYLTGRGEWMKVVIGKVSDCGNGDRKIIDVNGKSIGIFRVVDQFYAIRNRCPH